MPPWLGGSEKRLTVWDMSGIGWTADNVWLSSCMEAGRQSGWCVFVRPVVRCPGGTSPPARSASSCNMLLVTPPDFPPRSACAWQHTDTAGKVHVRVLVCTCKSWNTGIWFGLICVFLKIFYQFHFTTFICFTSKSVCIVSTSQKRI